jgi:hypothetical protein
MSERERKINNMARTVNPYFIAITDNKSPVTPDNALNITQGIILIWGQKEFN